MSQFHEDPRIVSAWIHLAGPLLRRLTPVRRRILLAAGALGMAFKFLLKDVAQGDPGGISLSSVAAPALAVLILLGFLWLMYRLAARFSSLPSPLRDSPQLCLHGLFWILLFLVWSTPSDGGMGRAVLVTVVVTLPFFLWRLGYMLLAAQRGKMGGSRFRDHLMYLWPLYGGSNTPYGKGLEYLSRHEARDEETLARAQLAGLKLLVLAGVWTAGAEVMDGLVFGVDNRVRIALGGFSIGLPRLGPLLEQPEPATLGLSWAAVYCELFIDVLRRAARGHLIIGVLRLFGFYVFRNTYKPLLAETVVGFWNRYYYYFKELLLDFFFYPAFVRWFRTKPVMRLFTAVLMAAFVGNMYYHLIRMSPQLAAADLQAVWLELHPRLVYCILLALGIFVSMRREQRRAREARPRPIWRRGLAIFGVWTFFALISIWNQKTTATIGAMTRFFLGLFGAG
jgi:hypothetical protein